MAGGGWRSAIQWWESVAFCREDVAVKNERYTDDVGIQVVEKREVEENE
jgi:hypothetical protein